MAQKRVEPGRGRKPGVVKSSKQSSTSNRAFYLIIGLVAVIGISALTWQATRPKGIDLATRFDTTLPAVKSNGYVIGSQTAPVEVTEFGDFECPQCGRFATLTEPDVRSRLINTGQLRMRYIDYPLPMHRNTWNASRAAACADEQGKFWEMHDAIFANQDRWNGDATSNPDKVLKQIGNQLGMNNDQFNSCVDTKKTQAKVQAHYQLAMASHVDGTPTFVFGNQKIAAFLTYDEFKKLTDSLAALAPKPTPGATGGDTSKKVTIPGPKKGP
jgi:protein-disulfide isomerase